MIPNNQLLSNLLLSAIVFVIAWLLSKLIRTFINRKVLNSSKDLNVDATKFYFLKHAIHVVIMVLALVVIFYSIPQLKTLGISLFAGAGIVAAIVGFASQQAFSNIVSGLFIVAYKPFRVGDIVKIGTDHQGIVEDITLRHTVIRNFENRRLIIPNSIVSAEKILNSSIIDEKTCSFVEMGISYDSDIDQAMKIMANEAENHVYCMDNRDEEEKAAGNPKVTVKVIGVLESAILLRAWVWTADPIAAFILKCDLLQTIKERFDREGIEIPFPYRTIVFKNQPAATAGKQITLEQIS
jgi:small-conductance mechanosensitive channel